MKWPPKSAGNLQNLGTYNQTFMSRLFNESLSFIHNQETLRFFKQIAVKVCKVSVVISSLYLKVPLQLLKDII